MNLKVKKIIAKEGLIIISLVIVSLLFFMFEDGVNSRKTKYILGTKEIELMKGLPYNDKQMAVDKNGKKKETGKVTWEEFFGESHGIRLHFPKEASTDFMINIIRRDFPQIKEIMWTVHENHHGLDANVTRRYDLKGEMFFDGFIHKIRYSLIAYFSLFVAYPLLCLFRFIIWSVKTLKNKSV